MSFLACLPLIAADLNAVLALDKRCLGGLWTRSGYQRELESDCSDLLVLIGATSPQHLRQRAAMTPPLAQAGGQIAQTALPNELAPSDLFSSDLLIDASSRLAASEPTQLSDGSPSSRPAGPQPLVLMGIGCLWAILEEAHITTMAIEPAQQGQKLGTLLLSELLLAGYRRGLERATLEVRVSNKTALRLYQKFGFQEAGIRKRYYADGEDARILWCSKLQHEQTLNKIHQHKQAAIAHITHRYQYVLPSSLPP
ncbi:MAG: GNAT family N-acetyltransferase [Cyanobacteria bacterium P01_A01_bin.116]